MQTGTPDIAQILAENIREKTFPALPGYRISISASAYNAIIKHAKENPTVEICGVLIGEIFKDQQGPFLEISDIIRGEYADNQTGQVMFTHKTWEYINQEKDTRHPMKGMVGWYHTHPDFGIFLSDQDVFIHRNFFDKPWQVAFVFDPLRDEEGFFIWRNGAPEKTGRYWLEGREIVDNSAISRLEKRVSELSKVEVRKEESEPAQSQASILWWALTGVVVVLAASLFLFRNDLKTALNEWFQERLIMTEEILRNEMILNTFNPERLYAKLARTSLISNLDLTIDPAAKKIYFSGYVYTAAHKKWVREMIMSDLKSEEIFDIQKIVVTNFYMAHPGETYEEIAGKVYGDPRLGDALKKSQSMAFRSHEDFRTLSFSFVYLPDLYPGPYVVR